VTDSFQRTIVLALAIMALTTLAGVAVTTNHDPSGATLQMVVAGLLGIAGATAGAHAANGHGTMLIRPTTPPPDHVIVGEQRGDQPAPAPSRPAGT